MGLTPVAKEKYEDKFEKFGERSIPMKEELGQTASTNFNDQKSEDIISTTTKRMAASKSLPQYQPTVKKRQKKSPDDNYQLSDRQVRRIINKKHKPKQEAILE